MSTTQQYLVVSITAAVACAITLMLSLSVRQHAKASKVPVTPIPEPAVEPTRELGGHEHHWKIREEISSAFANAMANIESQTEIIE